MLDCRLEHMQLRADQAGQGMPPELDCLRQGCIRWIAGSICRIVLGLFLSCYGQPQLCHLQWQAGSHSWEGCCSAAPPGMQGGAHS